MNYNTVEELVDAAYALAEERELCDEFQDFMDDLGVGRKTYTVTGTISFEVEVEGVRGKDEADALTRVPFSDLRAQALDHVRYSLDANDEWVSTHAEAE